MQPDPRSFPQRKRCYNSQVPSWLLVFSFLPRSSIRLAFSRPPLHILYLNSPFPDYGFPFAPLGCLAWPPAQISTLSVPQSTWSFWEDHFPSCMYSVLPPEVPAFTPPRSPCTTTLNRGLWQPGKGMSQKKNMPHGKVYLFPPNTHLKEMSQAYPENWVRVLALPSYISTFR